MRLAIFILILIAIGVAIWLTGTWRTLKSIYLILQVSPYEQTVPGAPRILVIGDSTGYGTGAGKSSLSIAGRIGADFADYTIVNNSKNGRTIADALETVRTFDTNDTYALILLQVGANDILQKRDTDVVRAELEELFIEVKKHSRNVVMMSNGNVGTSPVFVGTPKSDEYERLTRQFRELYSSLAAEFGVAYVDLFEERDEDPFLREPKVYMALDGLHPSAAGYALWYEKLSPVLHEKLQE